MLAAMIDRTIDGPPHCAVKVEERAELQTTETLFSKTAAKRGFKTDNELQRPAVDFGLAN
jgi:hypothetical protein